MKAGASGLQINDGEDQGTTLQDSYFPVSPDMLNPHALTDFRVYLKRGGRYVLYTRERQYFSRSLKQRLVENGIDTVYIPYNQRASYESYIMDNLDWILNDPEVPIEARSRAFLDITASQVKEVFNNRLPVLDEQVVDGVRHVVQSSLSFLSTPGATESISRFISHDYQTFSHSVHVFAYTMMLMHCLEENWEEETLVDVGVGALLHDIGKTHIPTDVLNKPGRLNEGEWEQVKLHPVHGMRMCTNVSLPQMSLNCIVFHHEKFDGTGYPSGMSGEEIPVPVRVLTCCDVYDAITSKRPYAPASTPFEALKIMSEEMKGAFDSRIFKSFINVLGRINE
ncbi:MAG: HD domain-containing protein [Desulfobacterales bacterium]|nr:HD domain-containing protein [Desulfobacterales bacterium]